MTTKPRVRKVRGRRIYDPEPQWVALAGEQFGSGGWVASRQRPYQHVYELTFSRQHVGYLLHYTDGWRWQTTWNPRTGSRRGRVSKATYPTWQAAASRLIRTDVGQIVCRRLKPPPAAAWAPAIGVRGAPWEPKPAEPEETGAP